MKTTFKQWKPLLGIGVIFLLGFGTGVLVDRALLAQRVGQFINNGPVMVTQMVQNRLTYDLSLDLPQQEQLHVILGDASNQIQAARQQIQSQVRDAILTAKQKTEAILHPDQLDRFRREMDEAKTRFGRLPFFPGGENNLADPTPAKSNSTSAPP